MSDLLSAQLYLDEAGGHRHDPGAELLKFDIETCNRCSGAMRYPSLMVVVLDSAKRGRLYFLSVLSESAELESFARFA